MPKLDLDDDWQALGKPSPLKQAATEFFERVPSMLDRFFAWLDDAIKFPFRLVRHIVIWLLVADNFMQIVLYAAGLCLAVGLFWVGREAVRAPNTITHCWITSETKTGGKPEEDIHVLMGTREWRSDVTIRRSTDFKVLQQTAQELNCPLR